MNKINKALCVFFSVILFLTASGCKADVKDSTASSSASGPSDNSSSDISSSTPASSAPTSSIYAPETGGQDYNVKDPFSAESNADVNVGGSGAGQDQGFSSDWSGPKGYVIVVPKNNKSARASAEVLKEYFIEASGVELTIVDDSTAATDKEIIIGNTNRAESIKKLKDSQMKVSLNGKKLVFGGGHDVTVDKAVRHFISKASNYQNIYTFTESTDFTSTLNGYKYVWGDEFADAKLDLNKWSTVSTKMSGGGTSDNPVLLVGNTEDVIGIKDGALRLTAYKDKNGKYHVPNSVHSQTTMNYQYGYVEISAKIPLNVGCFASFWTRSVSDGNCLAPGTVSNHFAEVDMFEVFRNNGKQCIGGNILKNFEGEETYKNWAATHMGVTQQVTLNDTNYHTYGYEWTPTEIKLYFDRKIYARFDITEPWTSSKTGGKGIDGWNVTGYKDNSGTDMKCFNEAQYLIFNHHLHHKDAFKASTSVTENESFKSEDYLIDYVRLYQLDGQKVYTK